MRSAIPRVFPSFVRLRNTDRCYITRHFRRFTPPPLLWLNKNDFIPWFSEITTGLADI